MVRADVNGEERRRVLEQLPEPGRLGLHLGAQFLGLRPLPGGRPALAWRRLAACDPGPPLPRPGLADRLVLPRMAAAVFL